MEQYGSIDGVPKEVKERFLAGSRPLMSYTNLLTFNSRAILIYVTCLLNCPWLYLLFEITVYNVLYVYMHRRHEELCRNLTVWSSFSSTFSSSSPEKNDVNNLG